MLLRSSSGPDLNSWLPHSKDSSSPEPEPLLHLQRTKLVSLTCSFLLSSSFSSSSFFEEQNGSGKIDSGSSSTIQRLLYCFGLGGKVTSEERFSMENEERVLQTLVTGDGVGRNGGRIRGGAGDGRGFSGGDGDDGGGGWGFFEGNNNRGSNSTDTYYQKMIEAKFLKEVKIVKEREAE
ncbi:uncharacterized protein LOC133815533 [Humulus lupulus]|uniref:uncharacterized protein LOC133815533 n=1 Tax=Humulus lupulus TaxID=3486 RepID=UPI002B40DFE8|nr:uncharacterized protein LOC133815533 [Humulus lupulus]